MNGRMLKVGDRVEVINAGIGAHGANKKIGTVVDAKDVPVGSTISGLGSFHGGLILKLDVPHEFFKTYYWRVSLDGEYKLLSTKKTYKEIDVIISGNKTKVVMEDKVGTATCNNSVDRFDEAYGVILAVARAYGLDAEVINRIVDALYDDIPTLEDYETEDILKELMNRIED